MARLLLVHWNAEEAARGLERLRATGHEATLFCSQGGGAELKKLTLRPPDAFVIDLSRLPSHGREIGLYLRGRKATRDVPLVFVDGAPDKVERVRRVLPDAEYATWRGIRGAVRRALDNPPTDPVAPGSMAGYSGTPLPKKLGIKPDSTAILVGAPKAFEDTLGALPDGARLRRQARGSADVVLLFCRRRTDLETRFATASRAVRQGGSLWICWPKRASGLTTDLTQQIVREHGLGRRWVDYKIAAIDATWSGLRFARRRR